MEARTLAAIQERLRRLITEHEALGAGQFAPAALVRGDLGIAASDRLAVYANAYFARIHDCLREDFGALARALGPAAFHDLVKTYLMMHPPTRPSLRHAGAHLAEHLSTEPFAEIFARRCPYGADLARLEWAALDAFDAPDSAALTHEELAAVPAADWGELRFRAVPCLRLLGTAWPVHEVRARFDREGHDAPWDAAPMLEAAPTELRVWRQREQVRYRAISPLEREALGALQAEEPFGALCDRLAAAVGSEVAPAKAAAWLEVWLSDELLARGL